MGSTQALDDLCDGNGFLLDCKEWTTALGHEFARAENIVLTEHHWEIITLLRNFY